jgi:hypothetical protein
MKKFTLCALIVAVFTLQNLWAQQAAVGNRLSDDDGGMVQVVPVDAATAPAKARTTPVMKSVRQVSIFLGSAWAEQETRIRERVLSDLSGKLGELQNSNITLLPASPSVEDFSDLSKTPVNDLAIQRKLSEMLANQSIPAADPATVYVVFLGAGIKSTVGGHAGGVDYAAYHTSIHVNDAEVRYVVVPFNENAERQANTAARAIVETAVGGN